MNKIKIHTILRYSLLVSICAYVSFSIYTKIQSSLNPNGTVLVELIELDTEENTEEKINLENQLKVLTLQLIELSTAKGQEYKYYTHMHRLFRSSYLEYDTPPPKQSC